MEILKTLRLFIKVFYFLAIAALIIASIAIIFIFFQDGYSEIFKINLKEYQVKGKWETAILLVISYIPILIGFYGVWNLKKFVDDISIKNLFSDKQIAHLRNIGTFIIAYIIASHIITFVLDIVYSDKTKIGIFYEDLIVNDFFIVIIGLFFLFLSEIFKISKKHKQENDLTI